MSILKTISVYVWNITISLNSYRVYKWVVYCLSLNKSSLSHHVVFFLLVYPKHFHHALNNRMENRTAVAAETNNNKTQSKSSQYDSGH